MPLPLWRGASALPWSTATIRASLATQSPAKLPRMPMLKGLSPFSTARILPVGWAPPRRMALIPRSLVSFSASRTVAVRAAAAICARKRCTATLCSALSSACPRTATTVWASACRTRRLARRTTPCASFSFLMTVVVSTTIQRVVSISFMNTSIRAVSMVSFQAVATTLAFRPGARKKPSPVAEAT